MKIVARFLALCMILLSVVSVAHAAPVAQVSCSSNAETLKFNASFFDLGVASTVSVGTGSGGAGAGKTIFQPLVVHTSLAPFQSLFNAATSGALFESCVLTTRNSTGEVIEFLLKTVAVTKVDAIAQASSANAARTAYTQVTFEYSSAQVTPSTSLSDDGGSSPANDGWVKVKNQPSN
jgi:Type VI secretion system effector, Hcp